MDISRTQSSTEKISDLSPIINDLCETAAMFWQRGWATGASGNYSVVLRHKPLELLVTAECRDKSRLVASDFVLVNAEGEPLVDGQAEPTAETPLHTLLAIERTEGAILHTTSVWSMLLADRYLSNGGFELNGYEMLKGLEGTRSHETSVWVEVFENTSDVMELVEKVRSRLRNPALPMEYGFLIRRRGLYTWGRDLADARRHVEIFEFLFECLARQLLMG